MSEKQCAKCNTTTENWYGVGLPDGSQGALCESCYETEKTEHEAWFESLTPAQKVAHRDELLRRAGIL